MIKGTRWVCIALALAMHTAHAQPAPQKPAPPGEKAGSEESLQQGAGNNRPWATGVSADDQKAAQAQFRAGNEQLNQGLFARASETYRAALKHWDHPAIHYNLALALMNLDQPIDAYESLEQAIKFGEAPLEKDKLEHAKEYMLLLEKQIAHVEVSCDKPGAKVSLDGKELFVAPGTYKARVRIGRHTFVADKKGYTTRINAPFIGPGETYRFELKLFTAEELTRYNRRWQATWMPYAVIGGGVVVGLVGVALELSAKSSYDDYDKAVADCNMNNQGCQATKAITDLRDSGDRKKQLGYVGYGLAGAVIGTGIVLAILNRPEAYQIRPEDLQEEQDKRRVSTNSANASRLLRAPAEPGLAIAPIVSPTMAGAMVQGSF